MRTMATVLITSDFRLPIPGSDNIATIGYARGKHGARFTTGVTKLARAIGLSSSTGSSRRWRRYLSAPGLGIRIGARRSAPGPLAQVEAHEHVQRCKLRIAGSIPFVDLAGT